MTHLDPISISIWRQPRKKHADHTQTKNNAIGRGKIRNYRKSFHCKLLTWGKACVCVCEFGFKPKSIPLRSEQPFIHLSIHPARHPSIQPDGHPHWEPSKAPTCQRFAKIFHNMRNARQQQKQQQQRDVNRGHKTLKDAVFPPKRYTASVAWGRSINHTVFHGWESAYISTNIWVACTKGLMPAQCVFPLTTN